jgi:hypothetical protein
MNNLQSKYEVMDSNQLRKEIDRIKMELQQIKNTGDEFKIKSIEEQLNFAEEMLESVKRDEDKYKSVRF